MTDDRNNPIERAEVLKKELATGGLGERDECARINSADMIQVAWVGRKLKQCTVCCGTLYSDKGIEWNTSDIHI